VNFWAYGVSKAKSFSASAITSVLNVVNGWTGWTGPVTIEASTGNRQPATVVINSVTAKGTFIIDADWAKAVGY
jgi:hypothetical protein